jgi:hypothetical protein
MRRRRAFGALALVTALAANSLHAAAPCRLEVVDGDNGWPVPRVELGTTSGVTLVTDNAGVAAFDLPEFLGRETWLTVRAHGYEADRDGFGGRGVRFTPTAGGSQRITVRRLNIAKRLGRLTGAGLFAESQKLGGRADWRESGVTGQDTVQLSAYRGQLHWAWGDTKVPFYHLGLFKATAATSPLAPLPAPVPPLALKLEYFRDQQGRPRNVIDLPHDGPVWIGGCATLPDREGREHLVCTYSKIKGFLEPVEVGLAEWNDRTENFDPLLVIWKKAAAGDRPPALLPDRQTMTWTDAAGRAWLYAGGLPNFRCPATYEAWRNPATWEQVDNPPALTAADGGRVEIAQAAVAWHPWRGRCVAIVEQQGGKASALGEIWYAEAPTPAGPWGRAVRVVTHDNYTFYNPRIDLELTPGQSPVLLFEGTFTALFAANARPVPRYDYNQILYRLDLDDPALAPARTAP